MNIREIQNNIAVVVVAAGRGSRSGQSLPKQYTRLAGKTVLERTIAAFRTALGAVPVQVVIGESDERRYAEAVTRIRGLPEAVPGGATRQLSVLAGLRALEQLQPEVVLIHDAARPFISPDIVARIVDAVDADRGAVPTLPVSDTLRRSDGTKLGETVSRENLLTMQTPQGFPFALILKAHLRAAERGDTDLTDDAEVFRRAGHEVLLVTGERRNFKLTHPEDFEYAERIMTSDYETRVGQGFDVHAFGDGDAVCLCGITIPYSRSLEGHSDADVGLHALTDALLGALADGDIGAHFPPTDPNWKGASSDIFLREALDRLTARGGTLVSLDLTLICEAPKIGPHRDAMRERISEICNVDPARVSVKATTSERLGFTGRGEGIAAMAVATINLPVAP